MRYLIKKVEIRSENAAKPTHLPARWLKEHISNDISGDVAVDYGCGKLRYTVILAKKFRKVYALDSKVQIEREQVINGERISILEYSQKPKSNIVPIILNDIDAKALKADFVLCANVLSAIPFPPVRRGVLNNIRPMLKQGGKALFSVQYSNSYFTEKLADPMVLKYRDGFMIEKQGRWSFYGIIAPNRLRRMVGNAGFEVINEKHNEGVVYITTKRG